MRIIIELQVKIDQSRFLNLIINNVLGICKIIKDLEYVYMVYIFLGNQLIIFKIFKDYDF